MVAIQAANQEDDSRALRVPLAKRLGSTAIPTAGVSENRPVCLTLSSIEFATSRFIWQPHIAQRSEGDEEDCQPAEGYLGGEARGSCCLECV